MSFRRTRYKSTSVIRAADAVGGRSNLARELEVTAGAVTNWGRRGIPADRVVDIEKATRGKVKREELRPDLYRTRK